MSLGKIFFLIAAVLFLLAALGSTLVPAAAAWGMVFLALGLFFGESGLAFLRRR